MTTTGWTLAIVAALTFAWLAPRPTSVRATAADAGESMSAVRLSESGTSTAVDVARLVADGRFMEAAFPPASLPSGEELRIRLSGLRAELVGRHGTVVTSTQASVEQRHAFPQVAMPRAVRAYRRGQVTTVSWKGVRGISYLVAAGPTRRNARDRQVAGIGQSRRRGFRVRVSLRRTERWVSVRGVTRNAMSPVAAVRVVHIPSPLRHP